MRRADAALLAHVLVINCWLGGIIVQAWVYSTVQSIKKIYTQIRWEKCIGKFDLCK